MCLKRLARRRTILFLLLWINLCFYDCLAAQEFEIQPTDITVKRGASVNLPCKVKNLKGVLQWTMGGFGLGTDRELKAFPRFMMLGSNETGNYTLHITAALLADEAEYQCQVSGTDSEAPLRSNTAKLTVLYPPKDDEDQVYINPESPLQAIAGSTVRITCRGGLTKPASKITWKKDNVTITAGVSELKEPLPNSMLESITSWVDVVPDKTFHKKNISCLVSHEALDTPIMRTLTMYVQYPPAVTIAKHFIKAKEGDNLKFTCAADGNPPNLRFRWEVNQVAVTGDFETEYTFKGVTRKDNQAKIACIVSNAVGNGKSEQTINVEYEPKFAEDPKDVDEEKGKTVKLKCQVESNPPPEIVWTHENSQKVIGHGAEWSLAVDETTRGMYRCRVATPGYSEISRSVEVFLRGPPVVVAGQISLGLEGNVVDIDCDIKSIPRPESVGWSRDGITVDPTAFSSKYTVEELPTRSGVRNRLTLKDATADDFGWYNCTAKNSYGSHTGSIELRKQQSLPLVTTLVAIIGGIIFLVIVAIIIILFKRQGKPYKDHELEKQTDQSSTQDSVLKANSRTETGSDMTPSDDGADYSHDEEWDASEITAASRNLNRRDHETSYRFSGDFSDSSFPPKTPNTTGAGYIPYVDYSRDYNPPPPINYNRNSLYSPVPLNNVDPRYSAAYGNPYLRVPPNSRAAQNIYGSDARLSPNVQESNISSPGYPSNNLNNVSPNLKNRVYSQIGQNRNVINNNINSQYVILPQSDGEEGVHGTHI